MVAICMGAKSGDVLDMSCSSTTKGSACIAVRSGCDEDMCMSAGALDDEDLAKPVKASP